MLQINSISEIVGSIVINKKAAKKKKNRKIFHIFTKCKYWFILHIDIIRIRIKRILVIILLLAIKRRLSIEFLVIRLQTVASAKVSAVSANDEIYLLLTFSKCEVREKKKRRKRRSEDSLSSDTSTECQWKWKERNTVESLTRLDRAAWSITRWYN